MDSVLLLRRDELMCDGEEGQFEAGGDAGLVEDVRQVALHGFFAQVELLGDVAVAATFNDAADDFELAWREAVGFALGGGCLAASARAVRRRD